MAKVAHQPTRTEASRTNVQQALDLAREDPKSTGRDNGLVITVGAYPKVIPADGVSHALLVAKVTTDSGKPVAGREVKFSTTGGSLRVVRMITDASGIACTKLTSERKAKRVRVKAKVNPEGETDVSFSGHQVTIESIVGDGDVVRVTFHTFVECPSEYHAIDMGVGRDLIEGYGGNLGIPPSGDATWNWDVDTCHGSVGAWSGAYDRRYQPTNGTYTINVYMLCSDPETGPVYSRRQHTFNNLTVTSPLQIFW